METKPDSYLERTLLSAGMSIEEASYLEGRLSKFSYPGHIADKIVSYKKGLKKDRKSFYKKAVEMISRYDFPDSVAYLLDNMYSVKKRDLLGTLDVIGSDYVSEYVNFLDIAYKRSKGTEFLKELFSLDKIDSDSAKNLIKRDVENREIKDVLPKEIISILY